MKRPQMQWNQLHLQRPDDPMLARLGPHPWQLTFSYGRALQDAALAAWATDGGVLLSGASCYD